MNLEDESGDENDNYEIFRDCVSTALIKRLATPKRPERRRAGKGRKNAIKPVARAADEKEVDDAEDLAEFIDVWKPLHISVPITESIFFLYANCHIPIILQNLVYKSKMVALT